MAVPLPVGHPVPCAAAEVRTPVGRRLVAGAVAEDVAIAFAAAPAGGQGSPEPGVLVGCVVRDDVDDDLDVEGVGALDEYVELGERAETGVDVAVVDDVVAAVAER